jgi:hypothetical protein
MTFKSRILDMLPALVIFVLVSLFTTYVTVAYVVRDPLWLATIARHADRHPGAAPRPAPGVPSQHPQR